MKQMKKLLFAGLLLFTFDPASNAQVLCISCFDQNPAISPAAPNLVLNGSFENTNCPNTTGFFGGPTWCTNSSSYSCDIVNWTSSGGGTGTYSSVYDPTMSTIPDGNNAPYFGNWYSYHCNGTMGDTSCFIHLGCTMGPAPAGYPMSEPQHGGAAGLSLSQTVGGLTVGSVYAVEFWTGGEDGSYVDDGVFGFDCGFGDTLLRNVSTPVGGIGRRFVVQFRATATSHTLKFTNWGHACGSCSELALDDVRMYPIADLNPIVAPCAGNNLAANATATDVLCNGDCNGTASVAPTGGVTPFTLAWSNGAFTPTINNLCAGSYSVTVTDANGATASQTVTVNEPPALTASMSAATGPCNGQGTATVTAGGGTAPYTYLWSPGGQITPGLNLLNPGTYTVTVTDDNGCTATATAVINPVAQLPFLGPDTVLCASTYVISAPAGTSWLWNTGATSQTLTVNQSGNYWVQVTSGGCVVNDTIIVTFDSYNNQVNHYGYICNGSSENFTSTLSGATTYLWNTGATGPTIAVNSVGQYWVMASNGNCAVTDTFIVTDAFVSYQTPLSIQCLREIDLVPQRPGYSYLWSTSATGPVLTVSDAGSYTVTVLFNFCYATETFVVSGTPDPGSGMYFPNVFTPDGNALNDWFAPLGNQIQSFHLSIYDRWGKLMFETRDVTQGWNGNSREGTPAPEGTYVYTVEFVPYCPSGPEPLSRAGTVILMR